MKISPSINLIGCVFLISILAFLSVTACQVTTPTSNTISPTSQKTITPISGGILKMSYTNEVGTLGLPPLIKLLETTYAMVALEGLVKVDMEGNPMPWLATSWEENSNTQSVTFRLRQGVKFHDGTEFNADAVKFNLSQVWVDCKKTGELAQAIKSVDVLDNYTVRINLPGWGYGFKTNLYSKYLAAAWGLMVSPTAYKANGWEWSDKNPVGTGPFKFVSWNRMVSIKYQRFDDYWGGKAWLDGIEFNCIADPMTQLASFKMGDQQIMQDVLAFDANSIESAGNIIAKAPSFYIMVAGDGVNSNSVWSNLKVRQAMAYAINAEQIAKGIGHGYFMTTPRNQLAIPGKAFDNPDVKGYQYNPNMARQLLAEAGYPNGFKTKIIVISTKKYLIDAMTAVQSQLKAIGIDASIDLVDPPLQFLIQTQNGWENGLLCYDAGYRNELLILDQIFRGKNFYKSTARPIDLQEKIGETMSAPDFKTAQRLMWELQKMAVDQYAIIDHILIINRIVAKSPKVHDDGYMDPNKGHTYLYWEPAKAWLSK